MSDPNLIILYVENAAASAAFYRELLGRAPVESSPNFAMFPLGSGMMLGLWSRADVKPAANAAPGGGELVFSVADRAAVAALHEKWLKRRLPIAQAPVALEFGYTFVALDPDGHRLRVMCQPQS
jgi:catechol 2,3-dioxygenase-like lactoylglutathione lyase family enzyme